jgi:hypothetical protein
MRSSAAPRIAAFDPSGRAGEDDLGQITRLQTMTWPALCKSLA